MDMFNEAMKTMRRIRFMLMLGIIIFLAACAAPKLHELQHQYTGESCDSDRCILNNIVEVMG